MIAQTEADKLVEAIHGARVVSAIHVADVLILELFHKGTDDGAYRLAVNMKYAEADEWPWSQGDEAAE